MGVVAIFFATPTVASAKSSNPTKSASLLKKFKSLTMGAPFSQVQSYLVKLTFLDPSKVKQYLKIGLRLVTTETQATKLGNSAIKVLKKSGLSAATLKKLTDQVTKTVDQFKPPTPTPTPYQAFMGGVVPVRG